MLLIESTIDQFENSKYKTLETNLQTLLGQGSPWGQTNENIFKIYE